jgi:hypothetical protein
MYLCRRQDQSGNPVVPSAISVADRKSVRPGGEQLISRKSAPTLTLIKLRARVER